MLWFLGSACATPSSQRQHALSVWSEMSYVPRLFSATAHIDKGCAEIGCAPGLTLMWGNQPGEVSAQHSCSRGHCAAGLTAAKSLYHSPSPALKACFLLPLVLWKLFPHLLCCRSQT